MLFNKAWHKNVAEKYIRNKVCLSMVDTVN